MQLLTAPLRAFGQLDDRDFVGVVLHGVVWSALALVALVAGSFWGVHAALAGQGWWSWLAALLGGAGATVLALFLFLPVAGTIASLFIDRIADAVERRHYPWLPPARPAPLGQQIGDSLALGVRVLAMQLVALLLTLVLPGVGLILGWVVAAWAIGRGLFVAVAMRRMDRVSANLLYRRRRFAVIGQGGLMAAASLVPLLNLLAPVLGTAAMVHVLHDRA